MRIASRMRPEGRALGVFHAAVAQQADVYIDMEAGSDTDMLTTALLGTHTHGSGGTWTISPSPLTAFRVSTAAAAERAVGLVDVGVTQYSDAGTRGWALNHAGGGAQKVFYTLSETRPVLSLGLWISLGPPQAWTSNYDFVVVRTANARFGAINLSTRAPGNAIRTETAPGGVTTWGDDILVTPDTPYWMAVGFDASVNDLFSLSMYTADGTLVGSSATALDHAQGAISLSFGIDNVAADVTGTTYFDDVLMRWDDAHPLLPSLWI